MIPLTIPFKAQMDFDYKKDLLHRFGTLYTEWSRMPREICNITIGYYSFLSEQFFSIFEKIMTFPILRERLRVLLKCIAADRVTIPKYGFDEPKITAIGITQNL